MSVERSLEERFTNIDEELEGFDQEKAQRAWNKLQEHPKVALQILLHDNHVFSCLKNPWNDSEDEFLNTPNKHYDVSISAPGVKDCNFDLDALRIILELQEDGSFKIVQYGMFDDEGDEGLLTKFGINEILDEIAESKIELGVTTGENTPNMQASRDDVKKLLKN